MTTDGYPNGSINLSDGSSGEPSGSGGQPEPEKPFATVDDLERRWHALTGDEREKAEALLADASDLIRSTCPNWEKASELTRERVCCAIVKRAMLAGDDTAGVSQHSQTAGPYAETWNYTNPMGDLYLTQSEKESLGGDGTAWAYDMSSGRTSP